MDQALYGESWASRGYSSYEEMALAKQKIKDKALADISKSSAKELIDATERYGKEFEAFDHMHDKDEFRRDKCAYEEAYRYVRTFYHPDFNQRIILSLNEAIGLSADVELIRNAAIEWVKLK